MLGKVFDRFGKKSHFRDGAWHVGDASWEQTNSMPGFCRTAQKQYTRTVLFSTVYDILSQVVFRIKPSVRAAYRDQDNTRWRLAYLRSTTSSTG